MPIKGISDRRRLIRVGKLHLGVKEKRRGREYPRQVDYFVCKEDASTSAESAKAFKEVYGDKPQALDIVFPVDDTALFADPNFKMYGASWGLICRGDGEEAMAKWDVAQDGKRPEGLKDGTWANKDTKSWVYRKIPCLAEKCPMQATERPSCKAVMNLQFMLPRVRGIGVWPIDTGSWNSIRAILDSVELVKVVTGGRVRGLPLTLSLVPKEVTPANVAGGVVAEGSRGSITKKTVQVLHVSLPGQTLPEMLALAAKLPEHALLPAPVDDEETPEDMFPAAAAGEEGPNEEPPALKPGEVEVAGQVVREVTPEESGPQQPAATKPPAPETLPPEGAAEAEKTVNATKDNVLTLGDLLNRSLQLGVKRPEVLKILDVKGVDEILNFQEAWERVLIVHGEAAE
jgi:hypothetical protein